MFCRSRLIGVSLLYIWKQKFSFVHVFATKKFLFQSKITSHFRSQLQQDQKTRKTQFLFSTHQKGKKKYLAITFPKCPNTSTARWSVDVNEEMVSSLNSYAMKIICLSRDLRACVPSCPASPLCLFDFEKKGGSKKKKKEKIQNL